MTLPQGMPKLLLAEDSETAATIIRRQLSGRFDVLHAHNGEEAWDLLRNHPDIELVITDIQMPRMSGQELLARIRGNELSRLANLPVIAMTAAGNEGDRNDAFANGANDFLIKPIDPVELQARVNVHQKLARTIRELETSRELLQEQATTDPLTKLKNRRAFLDVGAGHFSLARRHTNDLALIMIDVDYFKRINDTYGHHVGDEVLIAVAKILMSNARVEDVVARMGGEEFAVLLPHTPRVGAAVLAERIRLAIENHAFHTVVGTLTVTISAGLASYGVDGDQNLEQLMSIADRRLYLAKEGGRNRVVVSDTKP